MTQLSLFDELDAELEKQKQDEAEHLAAQTVERSGPAICSHCGETEANLYILKINHGLVFNGWCGKRLRMNGMAGGVNSEFAEQYGQYFIDAADWLASHGWFACNQHDEQFWDMAASERYWSSDVDYWEKV